MYVNIKNEDLRIAKTEKAINSAMSRLLEKKNFGKITVRDICEEALISRATFYARFTDKYDFLESWLIYFRPSGIVQNDTYEKKEELFNEFIHSNETIIINLVSNADRYTLGVLYRFTASALSLIDVSNEVMDPKHIVLANFYTGGMFNYFLWQVNNKFPPDVTPMNIHLYKIIQAFKE